MTFKNIKWNNLKPMKNKCEEAVYRLYIVFTLHRGPSHLSHFKFLEIMVMKKLSGKSLWIGKSFKIFLVTATHSAVSEGCVILVKF